MKSTILKVLLHLVIVAMLWMAYSFALFLGLQVRPLYGNLGLAVVTGLTVAYVYFGFVRRR